SDWFVTMDLKDAYFHIGIWPEHRKFLKFAFGGKVYQFQVLPFGLALSSCTFTKCMDAALAPLHLQGIRVLNYLDDWLILAHSKAMAASHGDAHQGISPLSGMKGNSPPLPRDVEALGRAPEGEKSIEAGFSSEAVETLLNARAPSIRKLYALKWRLFSHSARAGPSALPNWYP
ncbi:hypothetical protein QTP86_023600, partial [Hemibagrus guttatus]